MTARLLFLSTFRWWMRLAYPPYFSIKISINSDFLIRSYLELALFMVSDQYTGHKTTKPHLVYTGDRMNFAYNRR